MIDLIFSGLCNLISQALNAVLKMFMDALGFDAEIFNGVFPFAAKVFSVIQGIAMGLTICIFAYMMAMLLRSGSDQLRETPTKLIAGLMLAIGGIYLGNYILEGIMDVARGPYNTLLNWKDLSGDGVSITADTVLSATITDYFAGTSILIYLIALVMIGLAFIKLILEAVERYVVLFCLLYLSPMAFATLTSQSTNQIFKKFFSMFMGQCVLLILNVWSVKMILSMLQNVGIFSGVAPITCFIMGYAFSRVAQKMDSYLNQLGVNAAITGAGLGAEIMGTAMLLTRLGGGGKAIAGAGAFGSGGGAGGILGLGQKMAAGFNRYSPTAGVASAVKGWAGAFAQTAAGAARTGAAAYAQTGSAEAAKAAASAYTSAFGQKNKAAAKEKVREGNVWAGARSSRSFGGFGIDNSHFGAQAADIAGDAINGATGKSFTDTLSQRPSAATQAFDQMELNYDGSIKDPAVNAAMAQAMNVPGSEEFVRAANGTLEGASVGRCETNAHGMTMEYKTGSPKHEKGHRMEVITANRYNTTHAQDRSGFQPFTTPNGKQFYVRYDGPGTQSVPVNPKTAYSQEQIPPAPPKQLPPNDTKQLPKTPKVIKL